MKYVKRRDGEGFNVPLGKILRIACCDCGLVHDIVFMTHENDPGEVGIAARANRRATAARRRDMAKKATKGAKKVAK